MPSARDHQSDVVHLGNKAPVARRAWTVIALALVFGALLEAAVQLRFELKHGTSMVELMRQRSLFETDPATGLKRLHPHGEFVRQQQVITSNALGLRGPQPGLDAHVPRVIVLGASTVMGAAASDDGHTLPARLEAALREHLGTPVQVVNGGISGYTLADQRELLETVLKPVPAGLVVLYPGFNDFAPYCQAPAWRRPVAAHGLPRLAMPEWWMTDDLVLANTTALREAPPALLPARDPDRMDLSAYRAAVEAVARSASRQGRTLLVATVARSFRRDQDAAEQARRAAELAALLPCFSTAGLHRLFERHNEVLADVARRHGLPLVDLARLVPGEARYFANATHLTDAGSEVAAQRLADAIVAGRLLGSAGDP